MTTSTFTLIDTVKSDNERDWPVNLGMLDWDSTNIVFTKRSLIEFLKHTGVTVDTNFANIAKLPRYAKFGKLSLVDEDLVTAVGDSSQGKESRTEDVDFKPTRRVRTVPGGPHTDIFGYEDDDALSRAPPKIDQISNSTELQQKNIDDNLSAQLKPKRQARSDVGGNSTVRNLWDPVDPKDFKPTRRVRQGPGGEDTVGSVSAQFLHEAPVATIPYILQPAFLSTLQISECKLILRADSS